MNYLNVHKIISLSYIEVIFLYNTLSKRLAPFNNYPNSLHVHLYDHFSLFKLQKKNDAIHKEKRF